MTDLTVQLRRLQYAANMLNLNEFCAALGWDVDEYSTHKFREFQALGRLHVFDDGVLNALVTAYETHTPAAYVDRDTLAVRSGDPDYSRDHVS